jgi:hypothetical protein
MSVDTDCQRGEAKTGRALGRLAIPITAARPLPRPDWIRIRLTGNDQFRHAQFCAFEAEARKLGFAHAACGPLVRSSYHADRQAQHAIAD